MFLSRMQLNRQRRGSLLFRTNPQAMHAAVMSSFPPGVESRPLWRLEDDGPRLDLLVLSESVPSFEHIQEQAGWASHMSWETRSYDKMLARLQTGQRYAFRLTANPAHRVTDADGRKTLKSHVSVAHQERWLGERAERLGVSFLGQVAGSDEEAWDTSIAVSHRKYLRFRRDGALVTIGQARFEGVLEVVDPAALRVALVSGVGRAKGYGCGLLTLAPAAGEVR